MKAAQLLVIVVISFAVSTSSIWADTLILKSGDRIAGSFDGGTARVVRFRTVSGGVKEYDVFSVQQIQFSDEQKTTVLPTTSSVGSDSADTVYTIPAGSKIAIRMIDSIGGENQTAGSLFLASLDAPITDHGVEVVPKGADVWGRVTDSEAPGLELTQIFFDGNTYSLSTAEYHGADKTLNIPTETKLEFTLKEPLVIGARGL
jgi:hypothetical protein